MEDLIEIELFGRTFHLRKSTVETLKRVKEDLDDTTPNYDRLVLSALKMCLDNPTYLEKLKDKLNNFKS